MSNYTIFKEVYNKINHKDHLFDVNFDINKNYLNHFPDPRNNFERSFFQYLCQNLHTNKIIILMQNIVAIPLLIKILLSSKESSDHQPHYDALLISSSMNEDYICDELKSEFCNIKQMEVGSSISYCKDDRKFIKSFFKRYWRHPFFVVKCLMRLGEYSNAIDIFCPKALFVNNEFSFTASFLTEYCKFRDVLHINIMHGEKLFYIRDSFVSYSRYYVWDEYYITLMKELRAKNDQFYLALPKCLNLHFNEDPVYMLTYYLGGEKKEELIEIEKSLSKFSSIKSSICIRAHPRYSDVSDVKAIFKDYSFESSTTLLADSFGKTKCVVSLYSTVLYQAYINDKIVMIDDCSNKKKFEQLENLEYIMLHKNIKYMSNEISKKEK